MSEWTIEREIDYHTIGRLVEERDSLRQRNEKLERVAEAARKTLDHIESAFGYDADPDLRDALSALDKEEQP